MALTAASTVKISTAVKPHKLDVRPAQHRKAKAYTATSKDVTFDCPPMLQHMFDQCFLTPCTPLHACLPRMMPQRTDQ